MNWLLMFLPEDKRALLELAIRVTSALDTPDERKAAAKFGVAMMADGRVTVTEWTRFGKILGIYRNEKKGK